MRRALSFLTPLGGVAAPSPAALPWFPVVGAVLGLAVGAVWWGASEVWPPALAAALALAADLALTGMLHLDGLVDSADGLLAPLDRERRLEVMADPRAGAFGVGAAVAVLLLRWAALAALAPAPLLVAGLWCASRSVMAAAARCVPYARPSGLASAFLPGAGARRGAGVPAVAGLVVAVILAAVATGWGGAAGVAALVAAAVGVVALAHRRLGGFTGDVLGAAGLAGETAGLLVAAARW
ncbi:MAG TPA: adenosylcobinamide-GDP ribazoletransferase [Acidimicrobiales bacterium]|nr:adenosylcobinamide-GDP ribazoletransferase [Acidimicrobiales bacterium]